MADVQNSNWLVEQSFPSTQGEGRPLIDQIVAELEERGWSSRDVFAVHLALEEAFTNAIEHGNHCDPRKSFHVSCQIDADKVSVSVRDEGEGFKEEQVPNPCDDCNLDIPSGRGVLLIHGFMTKVWYNDVGNQIFMEKVRSVE